MNEQEKKRKKRIAKIAMYVFGLFGCIFISAVMTAPVVNKQCNDLCDKEIREIISAQEEELISNRFAHWGESLKLPFFNKDDWQYFDGEYQAIMHTSGYFYGCRSYPMGLGKPETQIDCRLFNTVGCKHSEKQAVWLLYSSKPFIQKSKTLWLVVDAKTKKCKYVVK